MTSPTPSAAPAAASNDIPIVTDAIRLARVLVSPGAVFEELKDRPTWWGAWLVVGILTAIINLLNAPFQQRVQQIMLERAGRPAPTAGSPMVKAVIGFVTAPIGVLVFAAILAVLLFMLMSAFGGESSFKKAMAIVFYSWPVVLIQQTLTVVVLRMRGVDSINGPQDMLVSLGADLLLPAEAHVGTFLRLVLAGIGPLQVWTAAIIATGVMILARTSKGNGWTVAVIYCLCTLLAVAGIGSFFFKLMGG